MEHSIELLKTEKWKGYEVAQMVGYSNAYYFGICFKKYTGLTLSEYRKANIGGE